MNLSHLAILFWIFRVVASIEVRLLSCPTVISTLCGPSECLVVSQNRVSRPVFSEVTDWIVCLSITSWALVIFGPLVSVVTRGTVADTVELAIGETRLKLTIGVLLETGMIFGKSFVA